MTAWSKEGARLPLKLWNCYATEYVYNLTLISVHISFVYLCVYSCRPVYVSAVRPQSKHIVVMIDHGASITDTQLQIAKDSALVILNAIDEHDKVCERGHLLFFIICICISYHSWFDGLFAPSQISVLSVAETVRSCSLDQCYKSLLSPATSETKRKMSTFVSNVKASDGATQHAAGFEKAFQLLRNTTSHNKQSSKSQIRRH